jgi:uncharacterized protein YijF (DUF1287 family)
MQPQGSWKAVYEGIMGRPAMAIASGHHTRYVGSSAGAETQSRAGYDRHDLLLLSMPLLAMVMVGSLTQALKTGKRSLDFGAATPVVAVAVEPVLPPMVALTPLGPRNVPGLVAEEPVIVAPIAPLAALPRAGEPGVVLAGRAPEVVVVPQIEPAMPAPPDVLPSANETQIAVIAPRLSEEFALVPKSRQLPPVVAEDRCLAPATFAKAGARVTLPTAPVLTGAAYGLALARAAHSQMSGFVIYNDRYRQISYPAGDVAPLYGVCTDVVIRAYRDLGVDLQQLVHEAGMSGGDTSIGHRRTETLRRFFARFGVALPTTTVAEDYRPGDIVTYHRPQNRHSQSHIAMVSDVMAPSGRYMILHNRGWGPQLEDGLFVDEMTGHYRYAPQDQMMMAQPVDAKQLLGAVVSASKPKTVPPVLQRRASARQGYAARRRLEGAATVGLGR